MLADVAVAVHPDDERYRDAIGKRGARARSSTGAVPVIADERVEPEFGTGALKITPGHDPTDFEIGRDHGLPELTVIGLDGRMNAEAGEFAGLTQEEADERVVAWLREHDQLDKRESYRHSVGTCERCHTRIEPLVSLQWWCAMEEPRQPAIEALARAARPLPPPVAAPVRDPLARGRSARLEHLAPALVGAPAPDLVLPRRARDRRQAAARRLRECGSAELTRDPDVLDTWFSSALWPFATLGWPEQTPELEALLPGRRQLDRAGHHLPLGEPDDLAGLELLGDLPFRDVIIHSTMLAPDGRRMSKSLGTGIDPLDADRAARRRRDPLRPAEDVVDAGRPLLRGHDRGGPQAREQALERRRA